MGNSYRTPGDTDSGSVNYHILPIALAKSLGKLAKDLGIAKLVTNYSSDAFGQGSRFGMSVRVPKRGSVASTAKVPGTAVTPAAATSTKADIAINQHYTWDILVEDYGTLFTQPGLLQGYLEDGELEIAEDVEASITALYAVASAQVGSAGGNASAALIRSMRSTARGASHLFNLKAPMYAVWGVDAEADLLGETLFAKANESGSTETLVEARLGRKFGIDHFTSNLIASVAGSPGAEHNMFFQKDAIGLAFVDMNLGSLPDTFVGNVLMKAMYLPDDDGVPAYSMRTIIGYDQKERGTMLTVDSIWGVGAVRAEHLLDVLS